MGSEDIEEQQTQTNVFPEITLPQKCCLIEKKNHYPRIQDTKTLVSALSATDGKLGGF